MRLSAAEEIVVRAFHRLYYDDASQGAPWQRNTTWRRFPCLKCPFDLWVYQEILFEVRPDFIVETGTHKGGTTLYMANLLDLLGEGRVVSIDVKRRSPLLPVHGRITYLEGSSVADEIVRRVTELSRGAKRVMVILDSDHSEAHVARELELYAPLVTPGSYLVVEDTNVNGHPVNADFGPGPHEAVGRFLAAHAEFQPDAACEKFLLTFNPGGFLRRLPSGESSGWLPESQASPAVQLDPVNEALLVATSMMEQREEVLREARRQYAELGAALEESLRQLDAANEANARLSSAFEESLRQLDAANEANAGFSSAVAQLNERNAELSELRGLLAERERRLAEVEANLAEARAEIARSIAGGKGR